MGSNPIADMSGWSHSARKRKLALSPGVALRSTQVRLTCVAGVTGKGEETKGTPALAFSLSLFHQISQCDQQWLLVGSSQFARVVKGDLRSTPRKCAWVRTP